MKLQLIILFVLAATASFGQNRLLLSRVDLEEKQNKPARAIPEILLNALSKGDIVAYYPKNLKIQVSYEQFLDHFGMVSKAQQVLANDYPVWFCRESKPVRVDPGVVNCMQYEFELGEEQYRNHITYQQEVKMVYVKLIYSHQCALDYVEKEGPVFKLEDIRKLKDREYKIINPDNPAVSYSAADYLKLRLFHAK